MATYHLAFAGAGVTGARQVAVHKAPWLTLRGFSFTIYLFIFLQPAPKTLSTHERSLELVSGADFWCNLYQFPSRRPSQGSRGPPWAPGGRKPAKNQRPDLSFYVCPIKTAEHREKRMDNTREQQNFRDPGPTQVQRPYRIVHVLLAELKGPRNS